MYGITVTNLSESNIRRVSDMRAFMHRKNLIGRKVSLLKEPGDSPRSGRGDNIGDFAAAVEDACSLRVAPAQAIPTSGRRIFYNPDESSLDLNVSRQLCELSARKGKTVRFTLFASPD